MNQYYFGQVHIPHIMSFDVRFDIIYKFSRIIQVSRVSTVL